MANSESIEEQEEDLRQKVRALDPEQRKQYYTRLETELRDPDTYAVLNYLFIAGIHHFYLGKWLRGFINLGLMIYGITIIMGVYGGEMAALGVIVILGVYMFELFELFRSQSIVREYNHNVGLQVLADIERRGGKGRS